MFDHLAQPDAPHAIAMKRLVPASDSVKARLTRTYPAENPFWSVPPAPHEQSLVAVFAAVVERSVNGTLSADDVGDVSALLDWIKGLPKYGEMRSRRYPQLGEQAKHDLGLHVERLQSPEFTQQAGWENNLVSILRSYMMRLMNHEITSFRQARDLFAF